MPSTYTDLGFELQAAGENLNTWGDSKLNNTIKRINYAISGYLAIALTTDVALTSSTSSTDPNDFQARNHFLKFTGTPAAACTITVPATAMRWSVWNATTKTVTFTTGSGATAAILAGEVVLVACDATNCERVQGTEFGGSRITGVADPTSAQDAATKAYADALAFTANAGVLPGQTGNANKILTTDGTTASWATVSSRADYITDQATKTTTATGLAIAFAVAL